MINILYFNITRLSNIIAIVKLALVYLANAQIYDVISDWYYVVLLILSLTLNLLFYLYFYGQVRRSQQVWNKGMISKLNKHKGWSNASVSGLRVGDFIKITDQIICPADVLIIDISESHKTDKVVLVNEGKITGINKLTRKGAIRTFKELDSNKSNLRSLLDGSVEYPEPSLVDADNMGTFKIKGDPKVSFIKPSNIIYSGSKTHSDYIVGMILYTGSDTKIFRKSLQRHNFFGRRMLMKTTTSVMLDNLSLFFLLLSLYTSFFIMLYYSGDTQDNIRSKLIVATNGVTLPVVGNYLQIVVVVGSLIPVYIVVLTDIIFFLAAINLESKTHIPVLPEEHDNPEGIARNSTVIESLTSKNNHLSRAGRKKWNKGRNTQTDGNLPIIVNPQARARAGSNIKLPQPEVLRRKQTLSAQPANLFLVPSISSQNPASPRTTSPKLSQVPERTEPLPAQMERKMSTFIENIPSALKKFFVDDEEAEARVKSNFKVKEESWVKVTNYGQVADLGSIDHVVFDKTNTLTDNKIDIVYFSSWKLTYQIEFDKMRFMMEDFKKNPEIHRHEEDHMERNQALQEDGFYSEKSQEYEKELEGEFDSKLFLEDGSLDEVLNGIKLPAFMPIKPSKSSLPKGHYREGSEQGISLGVRAGSHIHPDGAVSEMGESQNPSARNISVRERDNRIEHLLVSTTKMKNFKMDKLEALFLKSRRSTVSGGGVEFNDEELSEGEENVACKLSEKVCSIRSQFAFFFDNYTNNQEIEQMLCVCALFLYCGMGELKSVPSPSLINTAMVSFLKNLGLGVVISPSRAGQADELGYNIRIESTYGMSRNFLVVGVNPRTEEKQRTSIVVTIQGGADDQHYIYVRGEEVAIRSCLDMSPQEQTHFRNLMVQYRELMLNRIIFGFRKLTTEEARLYISSYSLMLKAKRTDMSGFQRLALPLEKNLKFIGCIGVKTKIKPESVDLVRNLKEAGIKVSLFSGDSYENSINAIKELKMNEINYNDKNSYFCLTFETAERGHMDCLAYIETVYHYIKAKNNASLNFFMQYLVASKSDKSRAAVALKLANEGAVMDAIDKLDSGDQYKRNLVISGKALSLIQKNTELEIFLRILLIFTNSIVGYDLVPDEKGYLVRLLRKQNEIVLAVGDGLNDIGMFTQANLSIQVAQKDVPLYFGDFVVNNLDIVQLLIFHSGFRIFKNLRLVLMFFVVSSTKFIATNIWFYNVTSLSTRSVAPAFMDTLTAIWLVDSAFRALTQKIYSDRLLSDNPVIYRERKVLEKKMALFIALFLSLVLFEIAFTFAVVELYLSKMILSSGLQADYEIQIALIFFAFFMNTTYFNFFFYRFSSKNKYTTLVAYHLLVVGVVLYQAYAYSSPTTAFSVLKLISDQYVLTCVLLVIVVPTYFNWVMTTAAMHRIFNPVRHFLMYALHKDREWDKFKETDPEAGLLRQAMKRMAGSSKSTVYHLISQVATIARPSPTKLVDPVIMKLLLINLHQFRQGFNKLLNRILDLRDRKKFTLVNIASHLPFSNFILIFAVGLYSLELFIWILYANKTGIPIWRLIYTNVAPYKLILNLCLLGGMVLGVNKKLGEITLNKMLTWGYVCSFLIEVALLVGGLVDPADYTWNWLPVNISSRMVSSSIPINFSWSMILIGCFDVLKMIQTIYLPGAVRMRITGHLYLAVLALALITLMYLKCSLKKKVGGC